MVKIIKKGHIITDNEDYVKKSSLFLPTFFNQVTDMSLITKNEAINIAKKLLNEYGVPEEKLLDFEKNYNNIVQKDLYKRSIVENTDLVSLGLFNIEKKYEQKPVRAAETDESKTKISFDCLSRILVEIYVDHKVKELESVYINLKLNNSSEYQSRITFSDYNNTISKNLSTKSSRWVEMTYRKLMKNSQSSNTQFHLLFENILGSIEENGIEDEFYFSLEDFIPKKQINDVLNDISHSKKMKKSWSNNVEQTITKSSLKNIGLSTLLFDPFTSIITSKVHYKALENLIENEQTKNDRVAALNDEINKLMLRNPICKININNEDYSSLNPVSISSNANIFSRK